MTNYARTFFSGLSILLVSCADIPKNKEAPNEIGTVEQLDAELDSLIGKGVTFEIIADSLAWSEGPVWLEKEQMLLFSDIPNNTVHKWTESAGKEIYLNPSGYTGSVPRGGETGANGLLITNKGELLLAQHGDRRIAKMNSGLNKPSAQFVSIADNFEGKKFNSPNDLIRNRSGDILFTDPPYGLEKLMKDSSKELGFQGVYQVSPEGKVSLLVDSLSRPNGLALSSDEKTLFIANSDESKKIWYAYDITENGLSNGRIFYNATQINDPGLPDGLKIDSRDNVFATGPGGVWIFNKSGKLLGKIRFPKPTSNCALTADEKTLFVTASDQVIRVRLRD